MRTYERTHPWISFRIDLARVHPNLWIGLGEAAAKCEHLSRVMMRPETAQRLHTVFLAKGVAATTAIEGNALSEADVLRAVEGKLQVPPSQQYLKQEVDNIINACNRIGGQLVEGTLPELSFGLIRQYNRLVLDKLPPEEGTIPGELRHHSVVVGQVYRGAPAEDCELLLDRLSVWLSSPDFAPSKGREIVYAIIKAVVAHLYLAWIHPFGNGNGRTARLLELHILLAAGVSSPAAHLLSNHYNLTRSEYYRQLDHASKSGGDILPFLSYAVAGFVDGLRSQLEAVWRQQQDVFWRDYVHEKFKQRNSSSDVRQRHLAVDLGKREGWVSITEIPTLTPRLAIAYSGKTPKTVQRDLNALSASGLIVRQPRAVRAQKEVLLSFLPISKKLSEDVIEGAQVGLVSADRLPNI
jgi:Fic family protein